MTAGHRLATRYFDKLSHGDAEVHLVTMTEIMRKANAENLKAIKAVDEFVRGKKPAEVITFPGPGAA